MCAEAFTCRGGELWRGAGPALWPGADVSCFARRLCCRPCGSGRGHLLCSNITHRPLPVSHPHHPSIHPHASCFVAPPPPPPHPTHSPHTLHTHTHTTPRPDPPCHLLLLLPPPSPALTTASRRRVRTRRWLAAAGRQAARERSTEGAWLLAGIVNMAWHAVGARTWGGTWGASRACLGGLLVMVSRGGHAILSPSCPLGEQACPGPPGAGKGTRAGQQRTACSPG